MTYLGFCLDNMSAQKNVNISTYGGYMFGLLAVRFLLTVIYFLSLSYDLSSIFQQQKFWVNLSRNLTTFHNWRDVWNKALSDFQKLLSKLGLKYLPAIVAVYSVFHCLKNLLIITSSYRHYNQSKLLQCLNVWRYFNAAWLPQSFPKVIYSFIPRTPLIMNNSFPPFHTI